LDGADVNVDLVKGQCEKNTAKVMKKSGSYNKYFLGHCL
jgi:hypothetical protein